MQRQGVPLIVSEMPLVGTGLEEKVARDSHAVVLSIDSGKVASVTADQIIVTKDGHLPESKKKIKTDSESGTYVYELRKFMRVWPGRVRDVLRSQPRHGRLCEAR